jgi:hypothetical protein
MKIKQDRNTTFHLGAAFVGLAMLATPIAHAQSQSFTYQGELRDGNNLAQGPHDLRFELLDAGGVVRQTLCADDVPVTDGRFTVLLDPGIEFPSLVTQLTGIRIHVRANSPLPCSDPSGFTALSPTQPFTRAPLASRTSIADRAITADTFGGQAPAFYKDAGNLTGLLPDGRLTTNIPRLNSNNVFGGLNRFGWVSIGLPNNNALWPFDITALWAVANLSSIDGLNGSILILANDSQAIASNVGILGSVNFDTFGATPGQIAYQFDPVSPREHSLRFRVGDVTQAVLTGRGRLGLGTLAPTSNLDIVAAQATAKLLTNGSQNGSSLTFTNGSPILATNGGTLGALNFESGIGLDGQIAYQWDADSGVDDAMQFRVGGSNWAVLTGAGSLGLGVLEPAARLHVRNGLSLTTPNPNSTMVMETANGGYFSLITRDDRETGLLFGNPDDGAEDAGIIYNNPGSPSGLEFRTGGNQTRLTILSNGTVRIPGTLIAGTSVIQDVQYATPKITFATITPADFRVVSNFSSSVSISSGEYATIPSGFVSDQLTAGVHLPNGAKITQIIVWMFDNSAVKGLTAQLVQVDQFTRSPVVRGTGTSGASSIFNQAIDCTPLGNFTINNESSFYRIAISTANNQTWDGNLGVAGVKIEYEMIAPIQ